MAQLQEIIGCGLLASIASAAMGVSRLRAPLGADEGYLWFGVQQLLRGRWPHRDIKSYEPGRYVWCAAFASAGVAGLAAVRLATHLFLAIALATALVVLRDFGLDWGALAASAVALTWLAHPQHKQFEHGWLLLAWAAIAQMLAAPTPATMAWAGATIGLSLFFGFNLFLYAGSALAVSTACGIVLGWVTLSFDLVAACTGAGILGLLPFLAMLASPEFRRRFYERRVATVLARGTANLSLPHPWPWRPVPSQLRAMGRFHQRAFQAFYLSLLLLPLLCGALVLLQPGLFGPSAPGMLAAAALGLFVAHHAASRADPAHMTQSAGPLCLLLLLATSQQAPVPGPWLVAMLFGILVWPLHPLVQRRKNAASWGRCDAGGLHIDCAPAQQRLLALARRCASARGSDGLFAAPAYPALYALLGADAPVYDTFCLYPADNAAQQEMVQGIERSAATALVSDAPVDGRDELRFSRTHPLVWAYLSEHFERRETQGVGTAVTLFVRGERDAA